ncbi:hypothetical protein N0824_01191 [Microcystis sp. 0824]|nr:hypothetical protein N0824_01191 [Microcystis sp. 0824]
MLTIRGVGGWDFGCWGGHCVRVAGGVGVLVEFPHFPISPSPVSCLLSPVS